MLTENAGLDDRLTSRENLVVHRPAARLRRRRAPTRRVDELLERFGMADRADDLTQGFSTGQRKRVALARALLHDPEVLFLDEPTSGLDPAGTRDVIELIQSLAGEGRTIVLATHFLGEAGRLADRMAVLHRGQLRAFGRPDELAAEIWDGVGRHHRPGRRRPHRRRSSPRPRASAACSRVRRAAPTGATCRVADREVLPRVVAALVGLGVAVYQVVSRPPTPRGRVLRARGRASWPRHGERRRCTDGFGRPARRPPGRRRRHGRDLVSAAPAGRTRAATVTVAEPIPRPRSPDPRGAGRGPPPPPRDWTAIRLVMRKDLGPCGAARPSCCP